MGNKKQCTRRCRSAASVLLTVCLISLLIVSAVAFTSNNVNRNNIASLSATKLQAAASSITSNNNNNILTHRPENILVEEATLNQNVDEHLTILSAARIRNDDYELTECEGLLLQKNTHSDKIHHYQAHITCHHDDGTINRNLDHFLAVFHKLLIQYLIIENELYEDQLRNNEGMSAMLTISLDNNDHLSTSELQVHLGNVGFLFPSSDEEPVATNNGIVMDLSKYEPFLNSYIIRNRGTEQGNASLTLHKMLCERRVAYQFSNKDDNTMEQPESITSERRRNVVSHRPSVLSSSVVSEVHEILEVVKSKQWLSTNPDSVDGLPSLHLNLISNGKPLFEIETDKGTDELSTFPQCINSLVRVLRPHLYENLLPAARRVLNSPTVEISDVFIRSYGVQPGQQENNSGDEDDDGESKTRFGLSPHFDVTAYATCVLALDAVASSGKQGLYTIPPTNGFHTSSSVLKKFFPLNEGDGVVHTFDILHGVDVDPKLNLPRTSLIVWFTDGKSCCDGAEESDNPSVNQPWLLNPGEDDDIGQFVLALASERTVEEDGSHFKLKSAVDPLQLYISSAAQGNVFAMTALGQMCDDGLVPDDQCDVIRDFLLALDSANPYIPNNEPSVLEGSSIQRKCETLTNALWYHAAIQGGHRVAQVSLADNLMLQYMTERDNMTTKEEESTILIASILLTQALHQGYNSLDMLHRIRDVECSRLSHAGVEIPSDAFFQSPVIQVLLLSVT